MKMYIVGFALLIIFTSFFSFQMTTDKFTEMQDVVKTAANDAADAAALLYDVDRYAGGEKVFNKEDGNKAILSIIKGNLKLEDGMMFQNPVLREACHYTTYFVDGTGEVSKYQDGLFVSSQTITFPFEFIEGNTNYTKTITEATVIVTIDAGKFDYPLAIIKDPKLIRTSGYEYIGNN